MFYNLKELTRKEKEIFDRFGKGKRARDALKIDSDRLLNELIANEDALDKQLANLLLLHQAKLFCRKLPVNVMKMRERIVALKAKVGHKNITIAKHEKLKLELEKAEKEIQKICEGHPFLIEYSSYQGSRGNDYDDRYAGRRLCILCGYAEDSNGEKTYAAKLTYFQTRHHIQPTFIEDGYPTLNREENRLIFNDFNVFEAHNALKLNLWQPLEDVLVYFVNPLVLNILKDK